ncbi:hypothetical protein AB0F16_32205, partial [Streptomyces tanashiensis]|uniref:hypothetical protein n=1 Tax=Streptomyces tanashiensis TaxID=67367 RepID=UPI0033F1F83B
LDDVFHNDDDTVTICLSGPDGEPYWLGLEPERAQALRDDLAPPAAGLDDTQPTDGLPERLATVLTERFTSLGNPFSGMRTAMPSPDGWPASRDVSPNDIADVLRELLAAAVEEPTS